VGVVDMPSFDGDLLLDLFASNVPLVFAEQNNGYLWQNSLKVLHRRNAHVAGTLERIVTINTLNAEGRPCYIHSGTYEELVDAFGLSSEHLARTALRLAEKKR
jgi:hypothetical protein